MTKEDTSNHKSWVISWDTHGIPHLKSSHFAPGYSRGHFATKQEAIEAESVRIGEELTNTREKIAKLTKLIQAEELP